MKQKIIASINGILKSMDFEVTNIKNIFNNVNNFQYKNDRNTESS